LPSRRVRNRKRILPLYEAKMVNFLNHRAADVIKSETAVSRLTRGEQLARGRHRDIGRDRRGQQRALHEQLRSRGEPAGMVHAVVTNDDEIGSKGLWMLACAAVRAGWDVADGRVVVERHSPPGIETVPAYAVQAAPGFIAFTAARGAFGRRPDYLLSGINVGSNTGQVVLHSGTVGAPMTAAAHRARGRVLARRQRHR
jgi:Survival protein SurE